MRARNIKPGFFENEQLAECSPFARLAFVGLTMMVDREGRTEDRPKRIKGELFPFDSIDMELLLRELAAQGLIIRYSVGGVRVIWLPTFLKHQRPHYKEAPSKLPEPPDGLEVNQSIASTDTQGSREENHSFSNVLPLDSLRQQIPGSKVDDWSENPERQPTIGGANCPESLNPGISESLNALSPKELSVLRTSCSESNPPLSLVGNSPGKTRGEDDPQAEYLPDEDWPDDDPEPPPTAKRLPPCPHLEVLALWAEVLPSMPRHLPALWRGTRARHLQARWRETAAEKRWATVEDGLAYFRRLFAYVGKSTFLTGRSDSRNTGRPPFVVELEWLVKPTNWAKVIEGKYHEAAA